MLRQGEGKTVTAATSAAVWTPSVSGANSVSVYNTDSSIAVYVLCNATAAELDAAILASTQITVRPEMSYTFNGAELVNISSVAYASASGTPDIDLAAF